MFKDAENVVTKKLILKEPEDALETKPEIIAVGCPFAIP
jgi:hypothetical protein